MECSEKEEGCVRDLIHDINGQLFLIRGHSEIAKNSTSDSERASSLDRIQTAADQLEKLFRKLRTEIGIPRGFPANETLPER